MYILPEYKVMSSLGYYFMSCPSLLWRVAVRIITIIQIRHDSNYIKNNSDISNFLSDYYQGTLA